MPQTQRPKIDDLVAWECNPEYTRIEVTVKNATGGAVALTAGSRGQCVKFASSVWNLCLNADASTVDGVIISDKPISLADAATTTDKHVLLVRGPAIIRKDGLSTTDAAGAAMTLATVMTALETALIQTKTQPTVTSTLTT